MKPLELYRLGIAAANAASEPEQRTAVNRLYYGLHHEACCRLFRKKPESGPLSRGRRHTELRDRYNEDTDPHSRTIGNLLNELRLLRVEADYNLALPLTFRARLLDPKQLLDIALQIANQLLEALDLYSPGEAEDGCRCLVA